MFCLFQDAYRSHSLDQMFYVTVPASAPAGSNRLTVSLGSDFANYSAEVVQGYESDGTTKTDLPSASIDSSGDLVLVESDDGFEANDVYWVAVSKMALSTAEKEGTLSTA